MDRYRPPWMAPRLGTPYGEPVDRVLPGRTPQQRFLMPPRAIRSECFPARSTRVTDTVVGGAYAGLFLARRALARVH